jgi:hypothetical protein
VLYNITVKCIIGGRDQLLLLNKHTSPLGSTAQPMLQSHAAHATTSARPASNASHTPTADAPAACA